MDLRQYYREIAEQEARIEEAFPLIVSLKTETGGKEGMISEVSRAMAARLIVEKRARMANAMEIAAYRAMLLEQQRQREDALLLERQRRIHMAEEELRILRRGVTREDGKEA
jgi:hypothetical protein